MNRSEGRSSSGIVPVMGYRVVLVFHTLAGLWQFLPDLADMNCNFLSDADVKGNDKNL